MRVRLPSIAKGLVQFECCADATVQTRHRAVGRRMGVVI
jgi:hypothetical protein